MEKKKEKVISSLQSLIGYVKQEEDGEFLDTILPFINSIESAKSINERRKKNNSENIVPNYKNINNSVDIDIKKIPANKKIELQNKFRSTKKKRITKEERQKKSLKLPDSFEKSEIDEKLANKKLQLPNSY